MQDHHQEPTIKGLFVKSHIEALRKAKGDPGVKELERRFGRALDFGNLYNVPVSDEVKIIEHALRITADTPVPEDALAFEAGRLHFRNFATTPFGKIVLAHPKGALKAVLLNASYIAEQVFQGISFRTFDEGPQKIRLVMEGGHYPLDHFKGLFYEWVNSFGFKTEVIAERTGEETYEYIIVWQ